jgi:hypothetical protein
VTPWDVVFWLGVMLFYLPVLAFMVVKYATYGYYCGVRAYAVSLGLCKRRIESGRQEA